MRNRRALFAETGVPESSVALMGQVHGVSIAFADAGGLYPGVDGLISTIPGILLGVLVADCVPLLLYDPANHAAGAIHCGWRSLTGGIVERALASMRETIGTASERVLAALGPAAGACCYETGPEVAAKLKPASVVRRGGAWYADLKAELAARLRESGVQACNIEINPDCTICNTRYFSHRRQKGTAGRMMGFIVLK